MFIDVLRRRNPQLIQSSVDLHSRGLLEPDTFVIDMDVLRENARLILKKSQELSIDLYFMMKQLGRNPQIAKELVEMGYKGAVVVDWREAQVMMKANVPLCNVGHLVQTPKAQLEAIIKYGTEVFTVYSLDKLKEINDIASKLGIVQKIIVKVSGENDLFYSGQKSGIELRHLEDFIKESKLLKNIQIVGSTAFPCFIFNNETEEVEPTSNYYSVIMATQILEDNGITVEQINVPSTTCVSTLEIISQGKGTTAEPGHGLSGTTPTHARRDLEERPAVLYLSEVSHNFKNKAYAYGGGHYRRSHIKNALIFEEGIEKIDRVYPPDLDSIDYTFELGNAYKVSSPVIMAFRFQIFVTRSKVALVEGIQNNEPMIIGIYDSLGNLHD